MNRVIVVGAGRAGFSHIRSYAVLKEQVSVIGIVDTSDRKTQNVRSFLERHGVCVQCGLKIEQLSKLIDSETIIDVCTPTDSHVPLISKAFKNGARRFVVEKPLAESVKSASALKNLDISVGIVEQYVYSEMTNKLKALIVNNSSRPLAMITDFSKDRVPDSIKGRGFLKNGQAPHAATLEMHHQLAMAEYLNGISERILYARFGDMCISKNRRLKEHGVGLVSLYHINNVISVHYTNLMHNLIVRQVRVFNSDGSYIVVEYPHYYGCAGYIMLSKNGETGRTERILHEDALSTTLSSIVGALGQNQRPKTDLDFGMRLVQLINEVAEIANEKQSAESGCSARHF
jgi:predicted dehydrogenase